MDDGTRAAADSPPVLDVRGALKRCGDDRDLLHELLNALPEQIEEEVAGIRRDLAGGRLRDASRRAHSLKGSCANLGAVRLAGDLAVLDAALKSGAAAACEALLPDLERTAAETCRMCGTVVKQA